MNWEKPTDDGTGTKKELLQKMQQLKEVEK